MGYRVRAKLLWTSLASLFEKEVNAPDARLTTLFWRLPVGKDDTRPIATTKASKLSLSGVRGERNQGQVEKRRATGQDQGLGKVPNVAVQQLYQVLIERVPDPAPKSWRTRITSVSRRAVSDALLRVAEKTVTKASLLASLSTDELRSSIDRLPPGVLTYDSEHGLVHSSDHPAATPTTIPVGQRTTFGELWNAAQRLVTLDDLQALVTGDGALARTLRRIERTAPQPEAVQNARDEIERWFDTSMQALTRFYRRQTRYIAAVLAVPLVLLTSADSVHLFDSLWRDQDVATAVASQAATWVAEPLQQTGDATPHDLDKLCAQAAQDAAKGNASSTTAATTTTPPETTAPASAPAGDESDTSDSATTTTIPVHQAIDEARSRLRSATELVKATNLIRYIGPTGLWHEIRDAGRKDNCALCDVVAWIPNGLVGRIVTWVALLFGASFWYDVLRRLVGLRKATADGGTSSDG